MKNNLNIPKQERVYVLNPVERFFKEMTNDDLTLVVQDILDIQTSNYENKENYFRVLNSLHSEVLGSVPPRTSLYDLFEKNIMIEYIKRENFSKE